MSQDLKEHFEEALKMKEEFEEDFNILMIFSGKPNLSPLPNNFQLDFFFRRRFAGSTTNVGQIPARSTFSRKIMYGTLG